MRMDPFVFVWGVDQDGYEIRRAGLGGSMLWRKVVDYDEVAPRGGPPRYYRPLDEDSLWLRFAEICRTNDGILQFANKYGVLDGLIGATGALTLSPTPVDSFLNLAERLGGIAEQLGSSEREAAADLLNNSDDFLFSGTPLMRVALLPKKLGGFEYKFVPQTLRDALLHQAAEAISGNRRFQRCRNEECSSWFRLGPREGGKTYTARREFCSDRCRVATARRQKKGALANA